MIQDWARLGPLKFAKLALYLHAEEDLRALPHVLSACADTVTHLEIAMGCLLAPNAYEYDDDIYWTDSGREPFPQKLPCLQKLVIAQYWMQERVEEFGSYCFESLMQIVPEDCWLRVDELEPWQSNERHPVPPWHEHLTKQHERLAKSINKT